MSLIFHAFECGTNATGYSRTWSSKGIEWMLTGSVERLGRDGAFPWVLSHQSSKSLVVAARCGRIFATFCPGRLRVSRAAVGLSCLASHPRGVSVAEVLLVLHAPRRSAMKPGTTPVE